MDNPTRIGIGAGAAFTLSAMAQPLITWWASAPLMAAFGGVALWGLWPIAEQSVGFKWPLSPVSLYSVSILTAARKSYEESERLGLDDLFTGNSQSPDEKLSMFANSFLVRKFRIYGRKPPSTVMRLIPESELPMLRAVDGRDELSAEFMHDPLKYCDVRLNRSDFKNHVRYLRDLMKGETKSLGQALPNNSGRIVLSVAASRLYGQIAETYLGKVMREKCDNEEQILDSMATLIAWRTDDLYVRRPGSSEFTTFRKSYMRYSRITGGAKSIRSNSDREGPVDFTDLQVERHELDRIITEIKLIADEKQ